MCGKDTEILKDTAYLSRSVQNNGDSEPELSRETGLPTLSWTLIELLIYMQKDQDLDLQGTCAFCFTV